MSRTRSIANRNQVYHNTPETQRSSMRLRILDYLRRAGPSTREEVAIALGKEVHQISGRFTALLEANIIAETDEVRPTRTGRDAVVVRLVESDVELGRRLVDRGQYRPPGMVASLQVCSYLQDQRERVRQVGQCETQCDHTQLIRHYATDRLVCPRTLMPCPTRSLSQLVSLYERINAPACQPQ